MKLLLGFVYLVGADCISPIDHGTRETVVSQVPCAVPVYALTGNPFKVVQEPNTISVAKPTKASKPLKKKRKKRK